METNKDEDKNMNLFFDLLILGLEAYFLFQAVRFIFFM